jgi:hypothetical protein
MVTGILATPRKEHAAHFCPMTMCSSPAEPSAEAILATTEIYDVTTGTLSPGPNLSTPRAGLTATALMDGKNSSGSGFDGTNDLATAEVFLPSTYSVAAQVRWECLASITRLFFFPNNNAVSSGRWNFRGSLVAATELFSPGTPPLFRTGAPLRHASSSPEFHSAWTVCS